MILNAVKIQEYKIHRKGERGLAITIPMAWGKDVGAQPGDRIEIYRDTEDRLIILPPSKANQNDRHEAREEQEENHG